MNARPRFNSRLFAIALSLGISGLLTVAECLMLPPLAISSPLPSRPPKSGRPIRTAQGGHRGQCPQVKVPLTAIVPLTDAQTIAPHPSIWFYSPYDRPLLAQFTLEFEGEPVMDPITIQLPEKPGLMVVQVPSTVNLAIDKSYQWFLKIMCDPKQPSQPPLFVMGWLRRVALSPPSTKLLREQIAFYTTQDLWLDAISLILERRLATPNDPELATEWKQLLRSLSLPELSELF